MTGKSSLINNRDWFRLNQWQTNLWGIEMMDGAAAKKNIQHPAVSTTQQYRFHKNGILPNNDRQQNNGLFCCICWCFLLSRIWCYINIHNERTNERTNGCMYGNGGNVKTMFGFYDYKKSKQSTKHTYYYYTWAELLTTLTTKEERKIPRRELKAQSKSNPIDWFFYTVVATGSGKWTFVNIEMTCIAKL